MVDNLNMKSSSGDKEKTSTDKLLQDSHLIGMEKEEQLNDEIPIALPLIVGPEEPITTAESPHSIGIFNFYHCCSFLKNVKQKTKTDKFKTLVRRLASTIALILYLIYFITVLIIPSRKEVPDYWCEGDGFLIINTAFYGTLLLYFQVVKPYFKHHQPEKLQLFIARVKLFNKIRKVQLLKYSVMIGAYVAFLLVDTSDDYSRLISAFGGFILVAVATLFSKSPSKIRLDQIICGIGLQMAFGLLILRWSVGKKLFQCLGTKVTAFLSYINAGTTFAFGSFLTSTVSYAFKILPVILYFGVLVSVLNHFGIIQWIIIKLGWILEISMGTTPCESMATVTNIFLGQSESFLVIRHYLSHLTKSELHAVMTGGFATVAGGIMAAYISFGVDPSHLISASIMSAPAAMAISKLFYPETEISVTDKKNVKLLAKKKQNLLQTIITDLKDNLPLIANIVGLLIVSITVTKLINSIFDWFCQLLSYKEGVCSVEGFFGILLSPVAWLMGVPWDDCLFVGRLIGIKVFISEFVSFKELMEIFKEGLLSPRSVVISTYALCGFSNISSMGCQLAVLGCLAPARTKDITSIVFRALIAGNFACFLTACVAGTLISEPATRLQALNGSSFN